jgi:hypothetical protein
LDILGKLGISEYLQDLCNFPFHFVCYGWDNSNYGYGGDNNNNKAMILTTTPITFNYQNTNRVAKLSSTNGAIITIDNELSDRNIQFQFLCSQMQAPATSGYGGNGFLTSGQASWEWMLTMKLYGIE